MAGSDADWQRDVRVPIPARPQAAFEAIHAGWCQRGSWLADGGIPDSGGPEPGCSCTATTVEAPQPAAPYRLLGVRAHRGITGAQLLTVTVECTDPIGGLLVQTLPDRVSIGGGRLLAEYAASGDLDGDLARPRGARSRP